jgi:hypothetical protein
VAPQVGALTLTGYAPTLVQTANQAVNPETGALVLTGYAPLVSGSALQNITPDVGALTITGYAPTIEQTNAADVWLGPNYNAAHGAGPWGGVPHEPKKRKRLDIRAESRSGAEEFGPTREEREAAEAREAADAVARKAAENAALVARFRAAREAQAVDNAIRAEAEAFVAAEQARLRNARLDEENARALKQLLELRQLLIDDDEEAALLLLLA